AFPADPTSNEIGSLAIPSYRELPRPMPRERIPRLNVARSNPVSRSHANVGNSYESREPRAHARAAGGAARGVQPRLSVDARSADHGRALTSPVSGRPSRSGGHPQAA